jgi:hypothetical protein
VSVDDHHSFGGRCRGHGASPSSLRTRSLTVPYPGQMPRLPQVSPLLRLQPVHPSRLLVLQNGDVILYQNFTAGLMAGETGGTIWRVTHTDAAR